MQPFEAGGDMPFSDYSSGAGGAASAMEMLEDLEGRYSAALTEIVNDENTAQKLHEDLLARNAQFIAETTATRNAKVSERRGTINDLAVTTFVQHLKSARSGARQKLML